MYFSFLTLGFKEHDSFVYLLQQQRIDMSATDLSSAFPCPPSLVVQDRSLEISRILLLHEFYLGSLFGQPKGGIYSRRTVLQLLASFMYYSSPLLIEHGIWLLIFVCIYPLGHQLPIDCPCLIQLTMHSVSQNPRMFYSHLGLRLRRDS